MKLGIVIVSAALFLLGTAAIMDQPPAADSEEKPGEAPPVIRLEIAPESMVKAAETTHRFSDINVHPEAVARYPMLIAASGPSVDYRIIEVTPEPNVEYRMPMVDPIGPRQGRRSRGRDPIAFDFLPRESAPKASEE